MPVQTAGQEGGSAAASQAARLGAMCDAACWDSAAQAANPHYISGPPCVQTSTTTLECSGKVAGLGSVPLFVVVNAPAGCTTQSGSNNPPGQANFITGPFRPTPA